ncbi:very short patch repair endonuclease [Glutamicibacter mysorens]|uniref:very short patch repair endonuclease n=1 Tax=Glutamicibacter mysorens TaxID=257984 RepID=UPI0020C64323|nr:very short patch repair endonuclease [Glutamicibacter mysorens]UTM45938.1 very short patch repair endonuclease [Glutamicibacter mysorens]
MDIMSAAQRSRLMSRISSKNTGPELALRRLLHAAGYRYRVHGILPAQQVAQLRSLHPGIPLRGGKLPGSPDLVFSARRKAIFVNGCFWHGHDCPVGQRRPASNTGYWNPKLDANIARDQRNLDNLAALGWESLTLWECELKSMDGILRRAASFLGPARTLPRGATAQDPSKGTGVG